MALTSPGVEVTIIDQSQYLPAPTNSVPLVILATAQNKANASGTAVAPATTAANAGKLYQVTSQRDLVDLYGTPFFYTTTNGTPIQGYELNEYGLLAAYSLLGATNRCYVLRADIDLASLVGQTGRPSGAPDNGAYWLDSTTTTWGIYEFNATTGLFTLQVPIVITESANISGGVPLSSIGSIGDYAINAIQITSEPTQQGQYFYKTTDNVWVIVGSVAWQQDWPTAQGTESNPTLSAGDEFTINVSGLYNLSITVPNSPNNNVAGVAGAINTLNNGYVTASVTSGRLNVYSSQPQVGNQHISFANVSTGTAVEDLGLTEDPFSYYQLALAYGTSAQMPLWTSSQSVPRPTGSVWIKVGSAGNGLNPVLSEYNATTAVWNARNVSLYTSDWAASASLDSSGGQAIPAGSIYAQYNFTGVFGQGPVYLWKRGALGPTVVTSSVTDYESTVTGTLFAQISTPGSSSLSATTYQIPITTGDTATDFVTAWSATNIPFTQALVTTDGAIQLIHTEGGEIILADVFITGNDQGESQGIIDELGFIMGTTPGCKFGTSYTSSYTKAVTSTTGSGINATIQVSAFYGVYRLIGDGVVANGSGYAVGDQLTISGATLGGVTPGNDLVVEVATISGGGGTGPVTAVTFIEGTPATYYGTQLSNWVEFEYTANEGAPVAAPANNTNWFWSVVDQVDIMVQYNGIWNGYGNLNYDSTGFPTSGANTTNPTGPIVSASEPIAQTDGTALVYGDIWIDTSDLELYPIIRRWEAVDATTDGWVLIDNADQTSSRGAAFLDARWATNGTTNPVDDPIPSIVSLLTSNYVDLDAPDPALYPAGMLLFNTRRSGYNVKQYKVNYFNSLSFPDETLPVVTSAWVSVSGNQANGAPYMGRQAQRNMVVESLRSVVDTNTDIRDEDNFFNLLAAPYYPELQPNMVVLNADRGETGYIIGDTPMRLPDDATAIQAWATNAAGAESTGEAGCVTRNTYLGLFYPSGIAPDLSGNLVAVPPSHMMLRTFLRNDTVAYPWLAPAGTRRGNIDNATNIGYLDATTGEFITIKTRIGIRDVLYINFINPLVFFTGIGLLNYGNKTSFNSTSALDRVNVARLIAYIRRQLTIAARPFVFEPNDALTRNQIAGVVQSLFVDLVAKRGIYDYLVVCDESNNTPARIDRNELWVDVAIEPVKAAEFIYIPVRVLNTGEIAALG
jgi:hypothetical protein